MGIGLCTGRKCSYKSHRTQDIRHFLISSKTNPYSRADYPPASPSATYFKREHLPISLLCSSLIAPGFLNLPHNLTTLSYERLHSSEKRILCLGAGSRHYCRYTKSPLEEEIWESPRVNENLTSVGFEPTTSGLDS